MSFCLLFITFFVTKTFSDAILNCEFSTHTGSISTANAFDYFLFEAKGKQIEINLCDSSADTKLFIYRYSDNFTLYDQDDGGGTAHSPFQLSWVSRSSCGSLNEKAIFSTSLPLGKYYVGVTLFGSLPSTPKDYTLKGIFQCTNPPTKIPTKLTNIPTKVTKIPTKITGIPTKIPTNIPTNIPTVIPTKIPSNIPTVIPTQNPSKIPTKLPTLYPTLFPTKNPTNIPTKLPTKMPTNLPTIGTTITNTKAGNLLTTLGSNGPLIIVVVLAALLICSLLCFLVLYCHCKTKGMQKEIRELTTLRLQSQSNVSGVQGFGSVNDIQMSNTNMNNDNIGARGNAVMSLKNMDLNSMSPEELEKQREIGKQMFLQATQALQSQIQLNNVTINDQNDGYNQYNPDNQEYAEGGGNGETTGVMNKYNEYGYDYNNENGGGYNEQQQQYNEQQYNENGYQLPDQPGIQDTLGDNAEDETMYQDENENYETQGGGDDDYYQTNNENDDDNEQEYNENENENEVDYKNIPQAQIHDSNINISNMNFDVNNIPPPPPEKAFDNDNNDDDGETF